MLQSDPHGCNSGARKLSLLALKQFPRVHREGNGHTKQASQPSSACWVGRRQQDDGLWFTSVFPLLFIRLLSPR